MVSTKRRSQRLEHRYQGDFGKHHHSPHRAVFNSQRLAHVLVGHPDCRKLRNHRGNIPARKIFEHQSEKSFYWKPSCQSDLVAVRYSTDNADFSLGSFVEGIKMFYRLEADALILQIKVSANASKSEIKKQKTDEYLEVRVAAVRDKGKANEELIAYLSGILKVPKSHIEILSGSTAPHKRVKIASKTPSEALEKLKSLIPT